MEKPVEVDFAQFLKEFAHGSTNQIATERLREVVAACQAIGAKGSITIKVSVDAKQGLAEIKAAISVKKPEPALPGACYYTTEDGALLDEDPRQLKLPTKVLDAPAKLKTIEGGNNG